MKNIYMTVRQPLITEKSTILREKDVRRFVRGDADSNANINLSDGVRMLEFLFRGGEAPVQSSVPVNVAAQANRHAERNHLHDAANGRACGLCSVNRRLESCVRIRIRGSDF